MAELSCLGLSIEKDRKREYMHILDALFTYAQTSRKF